MGKRLFTFAGKYSNHFQLKTREITTQANQYLCGLLQSQKRNMERMAEVVPESDEQAYQHFLSNSPWDERPVLNQVAREADRLLGGTANTALLIDEVGFTKKGTQSVGVNRQYNGRLGKVDNCQVGVFTVLSQGTRATLVDQRLYLPEAWASDPARCDAVGVPKAHQVLKTKTELALEMIRYQRRQGVRFAWVGADGFYGNDPAFLRTLDDDGERFVIDVHCDQRVYLEDPHPHVPPRKSARGYAPTRLQAQCDPIMVRQWMKEQPEAGWKAEELRDSTKGKLRVEVLHQRVWLWDGKEAKARHWHLIVRREIADHAEIKYSLSNAPADTPVWRLAQMQGQRYWIERQFEDGKGQVGMGHYQARGWKSWHHHMAMVAMALLFMLEERLRQCESYPLLSCADITRLLADFLPRQDRTVEELIQQMEVRHRKRQASINSAYRKQALADALAADG